MHYVFTLPPPGRESTGPAHHLKIHIVLDDSCTVQNQEYCQNVYSVLSAIFPVSDGTSQSTAAPDPEFLAKQRRSCCHARN